MTNEKITLDAEYMFEFASFSQWVNKASSWFKPLLARFEKTVCLDKNGNCLLIGEDFMKADKEQLFPVKVYRLIRSAEKK